VVGVVGIRQSGKTTMLRDQLQISNYVTLDDDDDLTSAHAAPKVFIARHSLPLIIDEVQKAPKAF
jgi:predicted AAA+ superfamily ATPase